VADAAQWQAGIAWRRHTRITESGFKSNQEILMTSPAFLVAAVVIVAILLVAALSISRRQRSGHLQRSQALRDRFGPEYDRTLAETGDARRAESELTARQKRVAKLNIRPLTADEGHGFNDQWQAVQMGFVDDPRGAVRDAEALLGRVMDARGYPEGDFDQRFADVSVDHSTTVDHYRSAHEIGLRQLAGGANTEDLRQAVVHDHALLTELIEAQPATPTLETVDAAPVDAVPVDAAPVDDAVPVDAAPVDAAPVDAAPVDAAPEAVAV
jgi:hypothetical protein